MAEKYFFGQGKLKLAIIVAGVVGDWRWVGDVSALTAAFSETRVQHRESYSGKNSLVRDFTRFADLAINATMHSLENANLELFTDGTATEVEAGTVTEEELPAIVAGDEVVLANPGVSSLVITDSAGSPVTIDPSHYELEAAYGNLLFNTLPDPAPTQPLNAAYSYAARSDLALMNAPEKIIALRYEGINLAEGGAPVIVEFYRVSRGLLQQLSLIAEGNEVAGMQITGNVLRDTSKPANGALGNYGRIQQLAA